MVNREVSFDEVVFYNYYGEKYFNPKERIWTNSAISVKDDPNLEQIGFSFNQFKPVELKEGLNENQIYQLTRGSRGGVRVLAKIGHSDYYKKYYKKLSDKLVEKFKEPSEDYKKTIFPFGDEQGIIWKEGNEIYMPICNEESCTFINEKYYHYLVGLDGFCPAELLIKSNKDPVLYFVEESYQQKRVKAVIESFNPQRTIDFLYEALVNHTKKLYRIHRELMEREHQR